MVDYDELREGLHKLQVATSADDESAIQVLLTEFDADGSGALDFEEFSALVKKLQDGQSKLAQLDSKSAPSSIKCALQQRSHSGTPSAALACYHSPY